MQKKVDIGLRNGTVITGEWQKKSYTIIRLIGSGMIGTVYLCRSHGRLYALKMGNQPTALVREVAILKKFNKVRDQRLGPFLYDVDDVTLPSGATFPFYVMEYIQGVSLESYIKQHGPASLGKLLPQLLHQLESIHKMGYIYGDLKNDNLLVINQRMPIIRLIDVGGVAKKGQSVKEYSNFFDRGYWQLGTRRAEPAYDLFALTMIFLTVYYPKQFKRGRYPREQLVSAVKSVSALHPYVNSFQKAVDGQFNSAGAMLREVERINKRQKPSEATHEEPLLSQAIILLLISTGCYAATFII